MDETQKAIRNHDEKLRKRMDALKRKGKSAVDDAYNLGVDDCLKIVGFEE